MRLLLGFFALLFVLAAPPVYAQEYSADAATPPTDQTVYPDVPMDPDNIRFFPPADCSDSESMVLSWQKGHNTKCVTGKTVLDWSVKNCREGQYVERGADGKAVCKDVPECGEDEFLKGVKVNGVYKLKCLSIIRMMPTCQNNEYLTVVVVGGDKVFKCRKDKTGGDIDNTTCHPGTGATCNIGGVGCGDPGTRMCNGDCFGRYFDGCEGGR
jgi:hypothetical protein